MIPLSPDAIQKRALSRTWALLAILLATLPARAQTFHLNSPLVQASGNALTLDGGTVTLPAASFLLEPADAPPQHFTSWRNMRSTGAVIETTTQPAGPDVVRLQFTVILTHDTPLQRLAVRLQFRPDSPAAWDQARSSFHYIPALKTAPEDVASDHVFRSPAAILTAGNRGIALIPDLATLVHNRPATAFLDLRFPDHAAPELWYGFENTQPQGHHYYAPTGQPFHLTGRRLTFACYLVLFHTSDPAPILRRTSAFLWQRFATPYLASPAPQTVPLTTYARYGYSFALADFWVPGPGDAAGPATGGFTESSFLDKTTGQYRGRDFRNDVWFQCWFNNMRTAYGLYSWGRATHNAQWIDKARAIPRLLLLSPGTGGIFPAIYKPADNTWQPSSEGGGPGLYYLPDSAWNAIQLLRFDSDLEPVPGAQPRLLAFARTLLTLQHPDGGFPARVHQTTLAPDPVLDNTASEALPLWFLADMLQHNRFPPAEIPQAQQAVRRGIAHLRTHVVDRQRYEEFETYFSCSPNALDFFDPISQLPPQSTLAMQWTAEAFLSAYTLFHDPADLATGRAALDMLSLYQQVWNPPYLHLYAFGGFGVMNTDAEWNDARQSQFAETYARFYRATGDREYLERGRAAMRAGFPLVVMRENRRVSPRTWQGTAYRHAAHGGSDENYGHSGTDDPASQTGFDWGTGSALAGAAYYARNLHAH